SFDESAGDGVVRIDIQPAAGRHYYRVESDTEYLHRRSASSAPAEYNQQYANALRSTEGLSLEEFSRGGAVDPVDLASISWDPTTATYWDEFNTSPADHNAGLPDDDPERRLSDFRLNAAELVKFRQNGFVVSPRLARNVQDPDWPQGSGNPPLPIDLYYQIWTDDLPVFITADSVLDAWHRTFLQVLEELEEIYLYPKLRRLLVGSLAGSRPNLFADCRMPGTVGDGLGQLSALRSAWDTADSPGSEHVRQAIDDLDLYLAVASRLIIGYDPSPATDDPSDPTHWYRAARAHNQPSVPSLYGDSERREDMTLYRPRGHYVNSQVLSAYFRSLLWLSRAQFHIASAGSSSPQRDRELRAAILLALQVRDRGLLADWQELETILQSFFGQSDAMTVGEMLALLDSLSLDSVEDLASDAKLATIRAALLASSYGIQEISGGQHSLASCTTPGQARLPRALSLFGQRWTPDAWAFTKVVFPEVADGGTAVPRRLPSAIDMAYSVLGNETARPILAERMADTNGVPFRDGFPFQQNLDTVRAVMDAQQTEFWTEHSYGSWLHVLRGLSPGVPASAPDTFQTRAWKRRILNTQLVSWTQLRHDTRLYAEQSYTPDVLCEFPDGYVDPYPEYWQRLADMAEQFRAAIPPLTISGEIGIESRDRYPNRFWPCLLEWRAERGYDVSLYPPDLLLYEAVISVDRGERIGAIRDHLANFSEHCLTLKSIAEAQLSGQPRTPEMTAFIEATVEDKTADDGYTGIRLYNGWFPTLYYRSSLFVIDEHPSTIWNPSVVDVHTSLPDALCSGDPGGILHGGVGRTQLMLVAVKHPDGSACTYAGPVGNFHEFVEPYPNRLSNYEWSERIDTGQVPPPEPWQVE
ncbi:MAG: DUF3160 domain-containing protein, partial [Verrucomicrobiales bacterium]